MNTKMQRSQFFICTLKCFCLIFIITTILSFESIDAATLPKQQYTEDANFWKKYGTSHLEKILKTVKASKDNLKAKNVIIFIGDGMGVTSVSAGRIYKGQLKGKTGEEENLVFEDFPNTAFAKTYNTDKQVPDSAGTATAIFSGVKTRYSVIGMDATTSKTDSERGKLTTIMDWAQNAGKRTGIVTTTRITHATPSSTYAHSYSRDWECDSSIPAESAVIYKDIARQLIENEPGRKFNVIMGGGLSPMGDKNLDEKSTITYEGDTETVCSRTDNRNLTDEWLRIVPTIAHDVEVKEEVKASNKRKLVKTREQLMNVNTSEVDYLMGLFRNNHITYSITREPGEPSLSEMVQQAIRILERPDSKGFVLMVEGGRIDQAHHQNYARAAMQEIVEMDLAVEDALNLTNRDDTLIIVTADHSHSLTFNGYPKRGNDILGFANKTEKIPPYETLTYANGPGFEDHLYKGNNTENESSHGIWIDVAKLNEKRLLPTYRHLATFPLKDESHGGEDVAVYAVGPGSELIRGTFEQNYLAYVMSYASCAGPSESLNQLCKNSANKASIFSQILNSILLAITTATLGSYLSK